MGLDRYIALIFLVMCAIYGYTAFFTMDHGLAPIMQRNPIWPSTFPKVLSVLGILVSLWIVLGFERSRGTAKIEIDYRRLTDYKLGQAVLLLGLMVVYALILRPVGFLISTTLFIVTAAAILGERKWLLMCFIAILASGIVWYLVDGVLGVYMRPLPSIFL